MGTRIEAVATASPAGGTLDLLVPALRRLRSKGALALTDEAARRCLEKAGRSAADVELLINVGIYRDDNLGEPALASMIQEDIGANPLQNLDDPQPGSHHGTFSFDLANSACGAVNAFQLVDRFIRSGTMALGLIVGADADPAPGKTRGFHYPSAAGAMLLSPGAEGEGFRSFHFEDFSEFENLHQGIVRWEESRIPNPLGAGGRNVLRIKESPGFLPRSAECAEQALARYLKQENLALDDIDLIVTSQYPRELPDVLERHLELPGDKIVRVTEPFEGALSAAPLAGLEAALQSGRFQRSRRVLFLTVGAGISVGLALYEQPVS